MHGAVAAYPSGYTSRRHSNPPCQNGVECHCSNPCLAVAAKLVARKSKVVCGCPGVWSTRASPG